MKSIIHHAKHLGYCNFSIFDGRWCL